MWQTVAIRFQDFFPVFRAKTLKVGVCLVCWLVGWLVRWTLEGNLTYNGPYVSIHTSTWCGD